MSVTADVINIEVRDPFSDLWTLTVRVKDGIPAHEVYHCRCRCELLPNGSPHLMFDWIGEDPGTQTRRKLQQAIATFLEERFPEFDIEDLTPKGRS